MYAFLGGKDTDHAYMIFRVADNAAAASALAKRGIQVVEQEESYTSKASFLDMDPIPVYGTEEAKTANFSGHRVSRGRYQTGNKSR